jgi:hypothetical protein
MKVRTNARKKMPPCYAMLNDLIDWGWDALDPRKPAERFATPRTLAIAKYYYERRVK